ncbi:hypothetical protein ANCDUO_25235, partial [Ancylostoma duodenale]
MESQARDRLGSLHFVTRLLGRRGCRQHREEYDRLVQHLRDSAKKAEGSRATKNLLSYETLELIRQCGAARAAGNYQLTSELAKRCREAVREDLKERRAAVLAEATETRKSIRNASRDLRQSQDQD